jgi:DNA-3-methyladenine glycosylase
LPTSKKIEDPWQHDALMEATQLLPMPFYGRGTVQASRDLLGCVLFHRGAAGTIVEVEAYLGVDDLASHSAKGITKRTQVIFGPPGRAYVYVIYGMHECLNVVVEPDGVPGCVLIRALEPLTDLRRMIERRAWAGPTCGLTNGPAKLTHALGITRAQYGQSFDSEELQIRAWKKPPSFEIEATPRIGITQCADWPLRFTWKGHPCLSR